MFSRKKKEESALQLKYGDLELLDLGRSSMDFKYKEEIFRIQGELSDVFLAVRGWTVRLESKEPVFLLHGKEPERYARIEQTVSLSVEEQDRYMCIIVELWRGSMRIDFVEDYYSESFICSTDYEEYLKDYEKDHPMGEKFQNGN